MNHQATIQAALAGLLAIGVAGATFAAPATPKGEQEKCYGIAKAGQNDCASTGNNSCAGTSKLNSDPKAWVYVPEGYCDRLVGGSKAPKA